MKGAAAVFALHSAHTSAKLLVSLTVVKTLKPSGEDFMRSQSCDRTSYISSGQMFGHKASAPETLVASTVGTRSSSFATINFSCLKK